MGSREEFMRQLGISADDMKLDVPAEGTSRVGGSSRATSGGGKPCGSANPLPDSSHARRSVSFSEAEHVYEAPDSTTMGRGGSGSSGHSFKSSANYPQAAASTGQPQPPRRSATQNDDARAAFLKSLGIDNADDDGAAADVRAVPTAAQSTPHASSEFLKKPAAHAPPSESHLSSASFMTDPTGRPRRVASTHGEGGRSDTTGPASSMGDSQTRHSTSRSTPPPSDPPAASRMAEDDYSAEECKAIGNACFGKGEYRKAIRLYTKAIDKDPANAALYSNRSAAYLQGGKQLGMDARNMALRDAEKVVELRPDWFKGYSRLGDAYFKLEMYSEAAQAYDTGLRYDPENSNLMHSRGEAHQAAVHQPAREKPAMSMAMAEKQRQKDKRSVFEMVDELEREVQNTQAVASSATGNDYRLRELAKYRNAKMSTGSMNSCEMSTDGGSVNVSQVKESLPQQQSSSIHSSTCAKGPRARMDPEAVQAASDAAAAYQQELLEKYRRKKGR